MAPRVFKKVKELEPELERLLHGTLDDAALLRALEELAREPALGLLAHRFGPLLYAKNRAHFRPFILQHLGLAGLDGRRWRRLEWKKVGPQFEAWLSEVDREDDLPIFRSLYRLKLEALGKDAEKEWRVELRRRLAAAKTPAQRNIELEKMRLGYRLDEESALALYEIEPQGARSFILEHLPYLFTWTFAEKRIAWRKLWAAARSRGDDKLYFRLYRRQVAIDEWRVEVLRLAAECPDADELCRGLEERHPQGFRLGLEDTILELLRARGPDVFPYVYRHLRELYSFGWGERKGYERLRALTIEKGWTSLWGALVRTCAPPKEFDAEIEKVLGDQGLSDQETIQKLAILAGVARELNFGPLGLALVRPLSDDNAVKLYESYPSLVRGPFKANVAPSWHSTYPKLLGLAIEKGDEGLVDYLASRILTRSFGLDDQIKRQIDELSEYYSSLLGDEAGFSRRAASVLGIVPAYSIGSYTALIRENKLARLFYERSASRYLLDPEALRDLLEASEIHAQALGFRALGLDDDRARQAARDNLDLLLASLLRPLHRKTRMLTFRAADNAITELEPARQLLGRARQALDLPDHKYPKDALVALIGRILSRWPELRAADEHPTIYRPFAA